MSLKGKIEAVIYAAEEPVTLAQLAALFGAEVLEATGESAPDAAAAPQPSLLAEASSEASSQADGFAESAAPVGEEALAEADADELKRLTRTRERMAREQLRKLLDELMQEYEQADRGVEIREIAGGYRVATKPEYHDAVRGFVKSLKPPMKLSLQALETLAVIAYKQPVTGPEVAEIRGVDSGGVLGSLISRKLVTTAGRKAVIGRPILYKTTREFLVRFGLRDLGELPSMEEFEKMAGELADEPEAEQQLPLSTGMEAVEQAGPATAEEVQAAPEAAEARSDEEVAAAAEATVLVTEEDAEPPVEPGPVVEEAAEKEDR